MISFFVELKNIIMFHVKHYMNIIQNAHLNYIGTSNLLLHIFMGMCLFFSKLIDS